jgi:hypothetical protein
MFSRKIAGFVSLLFCIIISACTQASVTSSPEAFGPINTIAPTLAPTITKEPTPDYIQYYCPDIATTSHLQDIGIVYGDTLDGKTYLWNPDTGQRTIISDEGYTEWGYATSKASRRSLPLQNWVPLRSARKR